MSSENRNHKLYTPWLYIVVELNQPTNSIKSQHRYKRHSVYFVWNFESKKKTRIHSMKDDGIFCQTIQIKWPFSAFHNWTKWQKKAQKKYYEFESRTREDYTRKLQKVLFIYILPLSFGLFQIKREKKHVSLCTLSFLRQRYFRFISDFRVLDFNAKSKSKTATATTKKQQQHKIAILLLFFFSLSLSLSMASFYSPFELNIKRKIVLCFFISLFIS